MELEIGLPMVVFHAESIGSILRSIGPTVKEPQSKN